MKNSDFNRLLRERGYISGENQNPYIGKYNDTKGTIFARIMRGTYGPKGEQKGFKILELLWVLMVTGYKNPEFLNKLVKTEDKNTHVSSACEVYEFLEAQFKNNVRIGTLCRNDGYSDPWGGPDRLGTAYDDPDDVKRSNKFDEDANLRSEKLAAKLYARLKEQNIA